MNFDAFAERCSDFLGSSRAFIGSLLIVLIWAVTGPFFDFSDTWQLVINTGTTVVTFWMIFVVQNTQNRDTAEMKAELRELVRAVPEADESVVENYD